MSVRNFFFIAIKPTLHEELKTRAMQANLFTTTHLDSLVNPVFLPLSFQFITDEDGIFELGNAMQKALYDVPSFGLVLNKIVFNSVFKQIAIQPEHSLQLEEIQNKIVNVLLDWNNFSNSPLTFDFPKHEVALARSNWSFSEFEKVKSQALKLPLRQIWTIETVSMMEWTYNGWNEKFFFPLEDQRLLRNQSNTILHDK